MARMMSACGVWCSACPAYHAAAKGAAFQQRIASAWRRIYGLREPPQAIACGGCLGPEAQLFHTSVKCRARRCCGANGFGSCAECSNEVCADLAHAQSVWDGVPNLVSLLSRADFAAYARPYCGHRRRLAEARSAHRGGGYAVAP
jgi:hypothetical protein